MTDANQSNPFVEMQLYHEVYTDPLGGFENIIRGQVERFTEWFMESREKGIVGDRLIGERPINKQ